MSDNALKWLGRVVAAVIVLIFAAVGYSIYNQNTTPAVDTPTADDQFLADVYDIDPAFKRADPDELVRMGELTCELVELDVPVEVIVSNMIETGFTPYQTGRFLGASINNYCPGAVQ